MSKILDFVRESRNEDRLKQSKETVAPDTEEFEKRTCQAQKTKKLPLTEQLRLLKAQTRETDTVIGKLYIQNPPQITGSDFSEDTKILEKLLGNACLLKETAFSGQGDYGVNRIFAVDDLLIGVVCMAYWGGQPFIVNECKVYRCGEELNLERAERALFWN